MKHKLPKNVTQILRNSEDKVCQDSETPKKCFAKSVKQKKFHETRKTQNCFRNTMKTQEIFGEFRETTKKVSKNHSILKQMFREMRKIKEKSSRNLRNPRAIPKT